MVKVLHLISTNVFSGAENVACQIIKLFSNDDKYKMVYCSTIGSNKESLENRKIEVLPLEKFNYACVKKAIEEFKPDIIHAHDARASIMAAVCVKKETIKIISHIHGNHENMRKFGVKTFLYNRTSRKYNKIIWVSGSAFNDYYYKNKIARKSIVLYNVINSDEVYEKVEIDKNNYNYDIIYLGRLTYPKNPIRLLEIIAKVKEKYQNLKVAIVGSGELQEEVKRKIEELHLKDCITLYGFLPNPYKILKSSKIMLMTSRYEGTPMCALEAIALNIPIVTTRTDGLKEIVKDGVTGYLSDANEVLCEKILYLLENPEELKEMKIDIEKYNKEINNLDYYKCTIEEVYKDK